MPGEPTILWYDYETSGADPRRDRPMEVACQRTSLDLEPVGEPLVLRCRLADDVLPEPDACVLTGLTPGRLGRDALSEVELMRRVLAELSQPATCTAGYNTIRFDDEITRFALWRSLLPVYEREWQNGNSRWDLIDPLRAAYALRPEGIEWPRHATGEPSFKLEHLTAANGIAHRAHGALSDVHATIEMAKLLRRAQPKLYDYLFQHRGKRKVAEVLALGSGKAVVHVSRMIPAQLGCTTLVLPVCRHPTNENGVLAVDLRHDPMPLLTLPLPEVARLLFTPRTALEDDAPRIGVKQISANHCPVVAPASVLDDAAAERISLDRAQCERHAEMVRDAIRLKDRLQQLYGAERPDEGREPDPDTALYDGFPPDRDRSLCQRVHRAAPGELAALEGGFEDWRLSELLFRFRARNHRDTLSPDEELRWREHCRAQLFGHDEGAPPRVRAVKDRIAALRLERSADARTLEVLDDLESWVDARVADLSDAAAASA